MAVTDRARNDDPVPWRARIMFAVLCVLAPWNLVLMRWYRESCVTCGRELGVWDVLRARNVSRSLIYGRYQCHRCVAAGVPIRGRTRPRAKE